MNKERLGVAVLFMSLIALIVLLFLLLNGTISFHAKKLDAYKEYKRISCTYHCSKLKAEYSFRRCMYDCKDFSDKRLVVK